MECLQPTEISFIDREELWKDALSAASPSLGPVYRSRTPITKKPPFLGALEIILKTI